MTQIQFRGKRMDDNGSWVYGSLVNNLWIYGGSNRPVCQIIIDSTPNIPFDLLDWMDVAENEDLTIIDVVPETVGQFTGEHDKDGNKVFTGDVVRLSNLDPRENEFTVVFKNGAFWLDGAATLPMMHLYSSGKNISTVIGNIFDNPEMR